MTALSVTSTVVPLRQKTSTQLVTCRVGFIAAGGARRRASNTGQMRSTRPLAWRTISCTPDDLRCYEPVGYVWSDQHDWKIQLCGQTNHLGAPLIIGDRLSDNRFTALYSDGAQGLSGAAVVNWPRALIECRRALQAGNDLGSVRGGRLERLTNPPDNAATRST